VIASAMAKASHVVHKFDEGVVFGLDQKQAAAFAKELTDVS